MRQASPRATISSSFLLQPVQTKTYRLMLAPKLWAPSSKLRVPRFWKSSARAGFRTISQASTPLTPAGQATGPAKAWSCLPTLGTPSLTGMHLRQSPSSRPHGCPRQEAPQKKFRRPPENLLQILATGDKMRSNASRGRRGFPGENRKPEWTRRTRWLSRRNQ